MRVSGSGIERQGMRVEVEDSLVQGFELSWMRIWTAFAAQDPTPPSPPFNVSSAIGRHVCPKFAEAFKLKSVI